MARLEGQCSIEGTGAGAASAARGEADAAAGALSGRDDATGGAGGVAGPESAGSTVRPDQRSIVLGGRSGSGDDDGPFANFGSAANALASEE